MSRISVSVEVDDLDDADLLLCVAEARKRGLLREAGSRRERLVPVYEALVARRTDNVLAAFEAAIFDEDDAGLVECYRALQQGAYSAAICHLDSEIFSGG